MDEDLQKMIANKKLVSFRVFGWIGTYTKGEICAILSFSRPTLERRLMLHNWRLSEIQLILTNLPFQI